MAQPNQRGKAIAITAMTVAGVALILCWVPIVNNLVFVLGIIAFLLAVVASVVTIGAQSSFRGMALAAIAVSVLSVIGVLASQAYYQSIASDAFGVPENEAEHRPSLIPSQDGGASAGKVDSSAVPSETDSGTASHPFPLGTTALVGPDYEVTVVHVKLDATAEVLATNPFNDPPNGQYMLVQMKVKYVGQGEGSPWIDLSPTFVGTDARQYDAYKCSAVLARGAMQVPTLENGGKADYEVCMDVPKGATAQGKIFVERRVAFSKTTRAYWTLS